MFNFLKNYYMKMSNNLCSCDFEVYGRVQGVFFRKNTQKMAMKLGVCGWCMNTKNGTVKGHIEGPTNKISEMKYWLENVGSPSCKIEKASFTDLMPKKKLEFSEFQIKR